MPIILFNEASLLKMFTTREKSSVGGSFTSCFSVVFKLHSVVLEVLDFSLVEFQDVALKFMDSSRILLRISFPWKFYCREDNVRDPRPCGQHRLAKIQFFRCHFRNAFGNADGYCHNAMNSGEKNIRITVKTGN